MRTHIIVRLVAAMYSATVVHAPATTAKRVRVGFLTDSHPLPYIPSKYHRYVNFNNDSEFKTYNNSKVTSWYIFRLDIYCNNVALHFPVPGFFL